MLADLLHMSVLSMKPDTCWRAEYASATCTVLKALQIIRLDVIHHVGMCTVLQTAYETSLD